VRLSVTSFAAHDSLGRPKCRWQDNIKIHLQKELGVRAWTTMKWLKIGSRP